MRFRRIAQFLAPGWILSSSLRARSGLDTGPMSGFDNDAVDKAFFGDNRQRVRIELSSPR